MREHHSSKCLDEWLQIGVIGIGEVVIHAGAPPWPQISSASLAMATPFHCDAGYMPRPQNDVSGIFVGRNGGLNAEVHSDEQDQLLNRRCRCVDPDRYRNMGSGNFLNFTGSLSGQRNTSPKSFGPLAVEHNLQASSNVIPRSLHCWPAPQSHGRSARGFTTTSDRRAGRRDAPRRIPGST
jgi:hypothetical protein